MNSQDSWYLDDAGEETGPFTWADVQLFARTGRIGADTYLRRSDWKKWKSVTEYLDPECFVRLDVDKPGVPNNAESLTFVETDEELFGLDDESEEALLRLEEEIEEEEALEVMVQQGKRKKCTGCWTINPNHASNCTACGQQFPIIQCPDCKGQVSAKADACIHCGCPLQYRPSNSAGKCPACGSYETKDTIERARRKGGLFGALGARMGGYVAGKGRYECRSCKHTWEFGARS